MKFSSEMPKVKDKEKDIRAFILQKISLKNERLKTIPKLEKQA